MLQGAAVGTASSAAGAALIDLQPEGSGRTPAWPRWGEGTVLRYDGDQVPALFDEHGYRELYVPVVLERGLLQPASG